jgi:hypothetical protein
MKQETFMNVFGFLQKIMSSAYGNDVDFLSLVLISMVTDSYSTQVYTFNFG